MKKLIVAETFYSLQCEGRAIGTPAVFLRLGGCNLLCKSATWICDTIDVWKKGKATPFNEVLSENFLQRLKDGAHLVITGGEPLLHQQLICEYLNYLREEESIEPFIEIETNGTIKPLFYLQQLVKYWNVSPKLSNCGESANKRINEVALLCLSKLDSIFKFVVAGESDIYEIFQDFDLPGEKIMLMPAGATQDELSAVRLTVVQNCINLGVRYSERLHIVIWNQKTGV